MGLPALHSQHTVARLYPVADRLLARTGLVDRLQRQGDFDEFLMVSGHCAMLRPALRVELQPKAVITRNSALYKLFPLKEIEIPGGKIACKIACKMRYPPRITQSFSLVCGTPNRSIISLLAATFPGFRCRGQEPTGRFRFSYDPDSPFLLEFTHHPLNRCTV